MFLAELMFVVVGIFSSHAENHREDYDIRVAQGRWLEPVSAEQVLIKKQKLNNRFQSVAGSKAYVSNSTHMKTSIYAHSAPLFKFSSSTVLSEERWHEVGWSFIESAEDSLGLTVTEFLDSSLRHGQRAIRRKAKSEDSKMISIWYQQFQAYGSGIFLEVDGAQFRIHFSETGDVYSVSNSFVQTSSSFQRTPPAISPVEALGRAADFVSVNLGSTSRIAKLDLEEGVSFQLTHERLNQPASVDLVYFPIRSHELRLAYKLIFQEKNSVYLYEVLIDAIDGRVLLLRNHSHHFTPDPTSSLHERTAVQTARQPLLFRAFVKDAGLGLLDSPIPMTPGPLTLAEQEEVQISRQEFSFLFLNEEASFLGWLRPRTTLALGENVMTFYYNPFPGGFDGLHVLDPNERNLSFPLSLEEDPDLYRDAAQAQLFFSTNWAHDRFWELGFTEVFGNFQDSNFGKGGVARDPLTTVVGGLFSNNAVFTGLPEDGSLAAIQLGDWSYPVPRRSSAFDNQVVLHEYGHGVTVRMVGGYDSQQTKGMGEGWGDFFSLSLLADADDSIDGNYPVGSYVAKHYHPHSAPDDYRFEEYQYFGMRRYPYSINMQVNPLTYADIDPDQFSVDPNIPTSQMLAYRAASPDQVHNQGEIWATTLWEIRSNLVSRYGFSGNELAIRIVIEALKYTPSTASMLEARDAILLADNILNNRKNSCELWAGFAKRGMGFSAQSPQGGLAAGVIESFDLPLACSQMGG